MKVSADGWRMMFVLVALAHAATAFPVDAQNGGAVNCPAYVRVSCGKQIRHKNGAVTQRYHLCTDNPAGLACDARVECQAFYRFDHGIRPEEIFYQAPIACDGGGRHVDIYCSTNATLELIVVGRCGRKGYTSQIVHGLFGKAASAEMVGGARAGALPADLPRLHLRSSRHNAYMQTGQTYHFIYHGRDNAKVALSVFEEGRRLAEPFILGPDDDFAFTPAHDHRLERSGPYALKETVAVVQEETVETRHATSFTLLLHRSYTARLRLLPGLLVLCVAVAASIVMAFAFKRRSWYR